jgi:hypothetical protein
LTERGVSLAQVKDLLGHASIVTTERYVTNKDEHLQASVHVLAPADTGDAGNAASSSDAPSASADAPASDGPTDDSRIS